LFERLLSEFKNYRGFLENRKFEDELFELFESVVDEFYQLEEKKLLFPKEFQIAISLYKKDDKGTLKIFENIENRYLMLSDLYDFLKIQKLQGVKF
jgi:hypothetical protein